MDSGSIRLTETVKKGGCAAKLPAGQLRACLSQLKLIKHPSLVVGTDTFDDACLWDLGDDRLLVQTLDFFTPIVDDAKDFGAIAAANALSDIYAMGGEPKIALTIMGFPAATLPLELVQPLMQGATDKIHEAGACLGGGHTIDDETLKLGFSVTGFVHKKRAWTNASAKPGDILILTKGLGTGTITSALKTKKAEAAWVEGAIASMTLLNNAPPLLNNIDVHAATDVTGFSLSGHAMQMAQASNVSFAINVTELPILKGALECLSAKVLNRAHHTNAEYVRTGVHYEAIDEEYRWLTLDPQTSGGLLLSIDPKFERDAMNRLLPRFPETKRIGEVVAKPQATAPWVTFIAK